MALYPTYGKKVFLMQKKLQHKVLLYDIKLCLIVFLIQDCPFGGLYQVINKCPIVLKSRYDHKSSFI